MRTRILEAAEQVVTSVGAAHLTLGLVAQTASVSKGGLLYHFDSKESLLSALVERYLSGMELCVDQANDALAGSGDAGRLKGRIVGLVGTLPRPKSLNAALLGVFANAPGLLKPIRDVIASDTYRLARSPANFPRAAIITLAIDGLLLRESLNISSLTNDQREAVVNELMRLADECYD